MTRHTGRNHLTTVLFLLALALVAGAGSSSTARAGSVEQTRDYWHIPVWAMPGAWQDSTVLFPRRCGGIFKGPLEDPATPGPDSLRRQPRTVTVRFLRNRQIEARPDFGGYRVYRVQRMDPLRPDQPDTTGYYTGSMSYWTLLRRYSVNQDSLLLWHFSRVDTTTLELVCNGAAAYDSVLTFVDADSSGAFLKVCRRLDEFGRCLSKGDSVWALVAPPGPHDGVRTWYSVTYEAYNTHENEFAEMYVPDSSDLSRCPRPYGCPNLNSVLGNRTAEPVEPTAGPTPNLQTVAVVPNPFRAREAWDRPDANEVHFINLPRNAKISIFTITGDLVKELTHNDPVRDFERWDLKNGAGRDVASGIYMYRIEAGSFSAQNRFVVIR